MPDLVPTMTAATTSGVTVTESQDYGGYPGWKAFDDISTPYDFWLTTTVPSVGTPHWLAVNFGAAQVVGEYTIRANGTNVSWGDGSPRDWKLQGSNDGTNWTDLDTRTSETFTASQLRSFVVASPQSFSRCRILVTAHNPGTYGLAIFEMEMIGGVVLLGARTRARSLIDGKPRMAPVDARTTESGQHRKTPVE